MANPEHVEIVKKGATAIAAWREKNPETQLDLCEADLSGADLSGADLRAAKLICADLCEAKLGTANLRHADLSQAELNCADLHDADLSNADLICADLCDADLSNADLSSADLSSATMYGTNLNSAKLDKANMAGAHFERTIIGDANLADTKGLKEVVHDGPSYVGFDILLSSQGKIPDVFLRGCGAPEALIMQLPAIVGSMAPIQFYSCFISYSSDDDAFAKRLHARMTAEKLRVWFAPKDMRGGAKFAAQIDRAIQMYDRTLLLLSEHSMKSEWVRREIKRARQKEKKSGGNVLFPITLVPFKKIKAWECLDADSGEDLAEKVREYHVPDFSQWKQEDAFAKAFGELMRDLKASG